MPKSKRWQPIELRRDSDGNWETMYDNGEHEYASLKTMLTELKIEDEAELVICVDRETAEVQVARKRPVKTEWVFDEDY